MEDCTVLMVVEQPALPIELTATLELASDFAKASKAKATQEAYGSDFRIFESWCRARGLRRYRPPLSHCVPSWPTRPASGSAPARSGDAWPPSATFIAPPATTRRPATRRSRRCCPGSGARSARLRRHQARLRPGDLRRPQLARRLRDQRGEARRQPDQDHRRDRPPQPRDAQDLFPRC
jgi:hypothetical protein